MSESQTQSPKTCVDGAAAAAEALIGAQEESARRGGDNHVTKNILKMSSRNYPPCVSYLILGGHNSKSQKEV